MRPTKPTPAAVLRREADLTTGPWSAELERAAARLGSAPLPWRSKARALPVIAGVAGFLLFVASAVYGSGAMFFGGWLTWALVIYSAELTSLREGPATGAVLAIVRELTGEPWDALNQRIEGALADPQGVPLSWIGSLSWPDRLVAFASVSQDPGPHAADLVDRKGLGRPHEHSDDPSWNAVSEILDTLKNNSECWFAQQPLCSNCYVRWTPLRVGPWYRYHGCPRCRSAAHAFVGTLEIVLDRGMEADAIEVDGALRVNGLRLIAPCDADRVVVVDATDGEIERLAIVLANSDDRARNRGHRPVSLEISPGVDLTQNTVRILERTFGSPPRE